MTHKLQEAASAEIIAASPVTATANGSSVDVADYEGSVRFILSSAAGSGTSPTLDVTIEDSADGSTGWAAIPGAAFTQVTDAAGATESIAVNLDNAKRYVRGVDTVTGTTPTFVRAVVMVGFKKYR